MFSPMPGKLTVFLILICGLALPLPTVSAQQPVASSQQPTPAPLQQDPASKDSPDPMPLSLTVFATANDADYREDFSSLSLKGSAFFPLPTVLGQKDDNPKMPFIRERLQMMCGLRIPSISLSASLGEPPASFPSSSISIPTQAPRIASRVMIGA
jgi:hypothetical protein